METVYPVGTRVRILEIDETDAFHDSEYPLIGAVGTVRSETMNISLNAPEGTVGGLIEIDGEAGSFYFYAIKVELADEN